jgi:hypothetical protein
MLKREAFYNCNLFNKVLSSTTSPKMEKNLTKGLDYSLVSVEDEKRENILILLVYYGIRRILKEF